ncbi:uncharacterized protein [Setaria viridis]|uniref:Uncharacterized protein n=1 Tax=Setaria viridis TaxID=4556 RepID=A0A4U6V0W1_SETVI|nr:hypothetical protein SEVIR_4G244100v2 [Setaria viridis]
MVSKQIRDRVQLMNYVMNNDSDVGNDNIWSTQDTLTLDAEAGSGTATASEREEERRQAEVKESLDVGAATAVFGFAVLLGCLCLPQEAKHPGNVRLTVSLLLSFATFFSGIALMLLSLNMHGLRVDLVSGSQWAASKCLLAACAVLSVLTLLGLLALLPGRVVYRYIGLAVVVVLLLLAAGAYWYLRLCADGGSEAAAREEHREELDAAWKITSCVANSAFGGLIGVLSSASKIPGAVTTAAYVSILLMFATAIPGMLVMMLSKKVPEITSLQLRRLLVAAIKLANVVLLCLLASAAFAAAFVVLRYRVFAAFAPLAVTAILCFLLRHCVVVRPGRRRGRSKLREKESQEARIKAMEDLASKVTTATLGAVMSVFGGALGERGDHGEAVRKEVVMVVLTSAFVSSFGFMLLAAAPDSARACLAPAARVLIWSSIALFAATAVAAYGAVGWRS